MSPEKKIALYLTAFLTYNLYAVFLLSAFLENTGYVFDYGQIQSVIKAGEAFDPKDWGWNGHYLWMLFSSIVTTVVSSLLCGAVSKDEKGITSLISSVPTIIICGFVVYLMQFTGGEYLNQTGTTVVAVLNMPITAFLAYTSGKFGAEIQRNVFLENTVFGVARWNLIWLAFPLYVFSLGAIGVGAKLVLLLFQSIGFGDLSFLNRLLLGMMYLLLVIPTIAWCLPLVIVYNILSGQILSERSILLRGCSNLTVLVVGWILAYGIQLGCFWIIQKVISLI